MHVTKLYVDKQKFYPPHIHGIHGNLYNGVKFVVVVLLLLLLLVKGTDSRCCRSMLRSGSACHRWSGQMCRWVLSPQVQVGDLQRQSVHTAGTLSALHPSGSWCRTIQSWTRLWGVLQAPCDQAQHAASHHTCVYRPSPWQHGHSTPATNIHIHIRWLNKCATSHG